MILSETKKIKRQVLQSLRAGFDAEMKAIEQEQQDILAEIIQAQPQDV